MIEKNFNMKKKPILTMHIELKDHEYLVGSWTLPRAIWDYVKHLYSPLSENTNARVLCQFNIVDIQKLKKTDGIFFEYDDIGKIPQYNKKKSLNGTFVFSSRDLKLILLNYWKNEYTGKDNPLMTEVDAHVGKQYKHRIRLTDETADRLLCNEGKYNFTMHLGKDDFTEKLLSAILNDRERVLSTPGTQPYLY